MVDDWLQIFFICLGIVKLFELCKQFEGWYGRKSEERSINRIRWCRLMEPLDMSSWSREEVSAESRRIGGNK